MGGYSQNEACSQVMQVTTRVTWGTKQWTFLKRCNDLTHVETKRDEKPSLVGGLVAINFIFPYIGNFIIPIDFHIFF